MRIVTVFVMALVFLALPLFGLAQTTTNFTYQGYLEDGGAPANGAYDFYFQLFDLPTLGTQIGSTLWKADIPVSNGQFTVLLDWGYTPFPGAPRFLQIYVRPGASTGSYTKLTPRQQLTPVPYAIAALNAWRLGGNGYTIPGANFLGTLDDAALEFKVNNLRALRLEPNAISPRVLGGFNGNVIAPGYAGAVIAGGGNAGEINLVSNEYAAVVAGIGNTASGASAFIGAGRLNNAAGNRATISGGYGNQATNEYATIGGGFTNTADGIRSAVFGGESNHASGDHAFVGGGIYNNVTTAYTTIAGGRSNGASANYASIGGGYGNTAGGEYATVAGGLSNAATNNNAVVGGGGYNTASAISTTVAGGYQNAATATDATVGGGYLNTAEGYRSVVAGGSGNTTSGSYAAVVGGYSNVASAPYSTVAGGNDNIAEGNGAFVAGGTHNRAAGLNSFAAGNHADAAASGCFVWMDSSSDVTIAPLGANKVVMRGVGGFYFITGSNPTTGAELLSGSGSWTSASDRNGKTAITALEPRDVLNKLLAIPISRWRYKTEADGIFHYGPMAQDFYAAFHLGGTDKGISTVDADGVAFAAIQGLYQQTREENAALKAEIAALRRQNNNLAGKVAEIDDLKARLVALERLLAATK